MCLWKEDGLKAVELGRRAGLEPSSMTGLLDRMERDGLLTRAADPGDRRAQRIHLTGEGRGVKKPVTRVVVKSLAHFMENVTGDDLDRFKETLRTLLANARKVSES
jgi:DNA-binding MarR family transcriptional regulator